MSSIRIAYQNFSIAIASSITLVLMPVIYVVLLVLYNILDNNFLLTIAIAELIDVIISLSFACLIFSLYKYLKNFKPSKLLDKLIPAILVLIIANSLLFMAFNIYAYSQHTANSIYSISTDFYLTISPTRNGLQTGTAAKLLTIDRYLSIVTWGTIFFAGIKMLLLSKRDFVGGLSTLASAIALASLVGIYLTVSDRMPSRFMDYLIIVTISIPSLYLFFKARQYGHWFGFKR